MPKRTFKLIWLPGVLQVLEFYGLDGKNKWAQLGYEALFFAAFTLIAWAVRGLCLTLSLVHA